LAAPTNRDFLDSAILGRLARLAVSARVPMIGSVSGIHRSALRGSSVEFAEYRRYAPGDDIKYLDWRVYARSDRFYMKEFEADTNLRCYLVLDCSASMALTDGSTSKFEYARRLAATLAYLLAHQGDAVGLLCFADGPVRDVPPRHTPSHLKNIFDTLAEVGPRGRTSIVKTIHDLAERARRRALIIVFSDFFEEVESLLDSFQHMRFRKHDLAIFHLLDRQELAFDFDRPIRFADLESSFAMITDPFAIRSEYEAEIDRYLELMRHGCEEHGVDYHRVTTDRDYEGVLADFLLQRKQRTKT